MKAEPLKQNEDLRLPLLIIPAAFLTYNFYKLITCPGATSLSCSLTDLVVVFPFYALVTSLVGRLNVFEFYSLYLLSSAIYLSIFYHFAGWFLGVPPRVRPARSKAKIIRKKIKGQPAFWIYQPKIS